MPKRNRLGAARVRARERSRYLARRIGLGLKDARVGLGLRQCEAAARAGVSQPFWSRLERGLVPRVSLETLAACAAAVDLQLAAFLEAMPGADLPFDIEHLRRQATIVRIATPGCWQAMPERAVDPEARRSRAIDVYLERPERREAVVVEIVDLLLDGGAALRGLEDKVAAIRREKSDLGDGVWSVQGLLVVRGTRRNRRTVGDLRPLFAARFRASSVAWLAALINPAAPMPRADGFLWSAGTDRLQAARLG